MQSADYENTNSTQNTQSTNEGITDNKRNNRGRNHLTNNFRTDRQNKVNMENSVNNQFMTRNNHNESDIRGSKEISFLNQRGNYNTNEYNRVENSINNQSGTRNNPNESDIRGSRERPFLNQRSNYNNTNGYNRVESNANNQSWARNNHNESNFRGRGGKPFSNHRGFHDQNMRYPDIPSQRRYSNTNNFDQSRNYSSNRNSYRENSYKNKKLKAEKTVENLNYSEKNIKQIDTSMFDQRELLIHELKMNKYECMICMNIVDKDSSIWSCEKCFHIFHLQCINKWAQSNITADNHKWRCPACQTENRDIENSKLIYTCFCKKQINPSFTQGTIAHSCGDVCAQIKNKVNSKCPHLCSLQCHPGQCPPCEASVTRQCHCGYTKITARCNADETQFQCQSLCQQMLNCGLHKCLKQCHMEEEHECKVVMEQRCWCDCSSTRSVLCGSEESFVEGYSCGVVCGRKKECGNHNCEKLCHDGDCEDCELMVDRVKKCCCGKMRIEDLGEERKSCLDNIPSCGNICGKSYEKCGHKCETICHDGECGPCSGITTLQCRCGSTMQSVECASSEVALCKQRCKAKLLCGKHRCEKQCCDFQVHLCSMKCGRMLTCKEHRCDRDCSHQGLCPSCPNVSFEELFCDCGRTFTLPPIACNQAPPYCSLPCSREHSCEHKVRHNCHKESTCPPCTELVNKLCPGGHSEYANVPCFRPVATCGLVCGKPLPNCSHTCIKTCHSGPCIENLEACKQPCKTLREDCKHPCSAPCHDGDCDLVTNTCDFAIKLQCDCGLRLSSFICGKVESLKNDPVLLAKHKLNLSRDSLSLELSCNKSCANALILSTHFQKVYISADNKSTAKYEIDNSLSCVQKCSTSCHHGSSMSTNLEKACNSSSYQCVQKYYAAYFEEFTRFNLNFVSSVEKVFRSFYQTLVNNESQNCSHQFLSISLEKSQFINRFSSAYKLICLVSRNSDNTANVIVKADRDNYCFPKVLLSKKVEEKYFKFPKFGC